MRLPLGRAGASDPTGALPSPAFIETDAFSQRCALDQRVRFTVQVFHVPPTGAGVVDEEALRLTILGVLLLFILRATFRKALCCVRDNHLAKDQRRCSEANWLTTIVRAFDNWAP